MNVLSARVRKNISHDVYWNGVDPCIVFITVAVERRKPLLANRWAHEILKLLWGDSSRWKVGRYTILPDHLHLFASPTKNSQPLGNWIRFWKGSFRKQFNEAEFAWQRSSFNRRLREESYDQKWHYVRNNPVRHKLVADCKEWEFRGEIYSLIPFTR